MANDVKVTLSADDQATEIVRRLAAAVKQLDAQQRAANKGTQQSKDAATGAADAFGKWNKAIVGVATALGAIRVLDFVRDTVQAADTIGKLAQKTGVSTEALSALSVAATTADLSQESLATSLKFLARSVTEVNQGVPQTVEAFAALGISAKDIKGLSLDQVLVRIANAQANFADGAGKSTAMLKIFGRSGEEIIPLLNDLAHGGFDEATKKAKALGIAFDADAAKGAQRFNDALTDVKNAAKGAVAQAFLPLTGALASIIESFVRFEEHHPDFVAFGAGMVIAGAGALVLAGGILAVTAAVGALDIALAPVIGVIAALAVLGGLGALIAKKFHDAKEEAIALGQAAKGAGAAAGGNKPDVNLLDPAQIKAAREARLAAAREAAKGELEITQAGLAQQQQAADAAFAQGIITLQAFYAKRQAITKAGIDAQVAELEREKNALVSSPLSENTDAARIKRASDIAAIEAQIKKLKIDGATKSLELTEQERQAVKALQSQLSAFVAQIETARGDAIGAAQQDIQQTVQRFREAMAQILGSQSDLLDELAAKFSTILTNRAAFDEKQRQADRVFTDLSLERETINQRAAAGLISQREATLEIAAAERARIPVLTQIADAMQFFGEQLNNKELLESAQKLRVEIAGMGLATDEAAQKVANLRDDLLQAGQADFSQFLGSTISQVSSVMDAVRQLALTIVGSVQRILADAISAETFGKIRSLLEGPQQTAGTVALSAAGGVVQAGGLAVKTGAVTLGASGLVVQRAADTMLAAAIALGVSATAVQTAAAAANVINAFGQGGIAALLPFASGGFVRGPGSSTSDSIPARLSHGEYVIRAAAVKRLGVNLLNAINFGGHMPRLRRFSAGVPGFADGGLVTGASGGSAEGHLHATIGLEEGLVLSHLESRGGVRSLLKIVAQHPNAFKASLGIA